MNQEQAQKAFLEETQEMLRQFEALLLAADSGELEADGLNALFRCAHTIKGSAALFPFDTIVNFTHAVESCLGRVRNGSLAMSHELVATLLLAGDRIAVMVDVIQTTGKPPADFGAAEIEVLQALNTLMADVDNHAGIAFHDASSSADTRCEPPQWKIAVRFGDHVMTNGFDPLALLRYLASLGEIRDLHLDASRLPSLAAMDPEVCYLGFDFVLATISARCDIDNAFEFVRDDSQVEITALPEKTRPVPPQMDAPAIPAKGVVKDAAERHATESGYIKVEAVKLDSLIDLVGELVIANASALLLAKDRRDGPILEAMSNILTLVEKIRDNSLTLRMVPVGDIFNRFPRIVYDIAKSLGKEIELHIHGADTELDKSMIEKLSDPLIHIVRNALDHGVEPLDQRQAAGKPANASITLAAYHESGSVVIEISDDGRGISRRRVFDKAVERGLAGAADVMSDDELLQLIFAPGFSTSETVTDLSGRGVGMDVVKRNIEALRGEVEIHSIEGEGTTIRLRLPLTLAVIDGFMVRVEHSHFVIPLEMVHECLELVDGGQESHYLELRGHILPLIVLRDLFRVPGMRPARENVVVVQYGQRRAGLVVDHLQGELQVVIKPLGAMFRSIQGISGSAVLGSGDVALILDIPLLVQLVLRHERDAANNKRESELKEINQIA